MRSPTLPLLLTTLLITTFAAPAPEPSTVSPAAGQGMGSTSSGSSGAAGGTTGMVSAPSSCTPGAYKCLSDSGRGIRYLHCNGSKKWIAQLCAPGTVCYTKGSGILCDR
ncbi:hypothetical protein HDV00_009717 [Rhizophlyctis rosea]|nr:hypothetical protein HDV00_009717 [Rhizophlyctis rosea]